ncbi:MAG: ABC-type transport auxiliary lipoprotein family protein [Erythrobacter sp.]
MLRQFFSFRSASALGMAALLSGCVSFGEEPPPSLLNLTADLQAPTGETRSVSAAQTLIVAEPEVPAEIDVLRLPVRVNDTSIAYLQDAVWVEKPARLFRRLLAETIRTRTGRTVLDGDTIGVAAGSRLSGTLREFGYNAAQSAVVLRYDAVMRTGDDTVITRRFSQSVDGVPAEANAVGFAMNSAANDLAKEVTAWVETNS